jgi:hypothetical protein
MAECEMGSSIFLFFSRLSFGGGAKSGENLTLSAQSSPHGVISHQGGNSYGADSLHLQVEIGLAEIPR